MIETKINDIQVIARDKNQILWGYNIIKPQDNIEELPIQAQPQPATGLVKAKRQAEEKVSETRTKN